RARRSPSRIAGAIALPLRGVRAYTHRGQDAHATLASRDLGLERFLLGELALDFLLHLPQNVQAADADVEVAAGEDHQERHAAARELVPEADEDEAGHVTAEGDLDQRHHQPLEREEIRWRRWRRGGGCGGNR